MTKTADTDLLGNESRLHTSQSALETEENPRLSQAGKPTTATSATAVADSAPNTAGDPEETTPGRGENAAGFLKGNP